MLIFQWGQIKVHYYLRIKRKQFVKKQVDLKEFLYKKFLLFLILGFTPKQLQRLYTRFQELEKRTPPLGYLTRQDLLGIREVALNPLGERLVDVIINDHG
jgi:hypothetical protein